MILEVDTRSFPHMWCMNIDVEKSTFRYLKKGILEIAKLDLKLISWFVTVINPIFQQEERDRTTSEGLLRLDS